MKNATAISIPAGIVIAVICCGPVLSESMTPRPDSNPGKTAPDAAPNNDASSARGDLSEKLNRSNGVIHPDASVDQQMQKPAPDTGTMPVIPPSNGTGAQPK
jgi:hypothetical protein